MLKQIIQIRNGEVPILTNESKSKKMVLYFHGLDGSAAFSKPLFKKLSMYKIVAMESRGHSNSKLKSSRLISKHIKDYLDVINHFKREGYKIWIVAESMGAAYATYIAYKLKNINIEGIFAWSIPNKLKNIMNASKIKQFTIKLMTTISFLTNLKYRYKSSVNYNLLSSNKTLHRLARLADKNKIRDVRETLATWAVNKKAWKYLSSWKKNETQLFYFQPEKDVIVNIDKARKKLSKSNLINKEYLFIPNAKHILMYEEQFKIVVNKIKKIIGD